MSDTYEPIPTHPPSNPNKTADKNGYWSRFYPGFVRRLSVWAEDGSQTLLYEQPADEPFYLPPGYTRPWASSTVELVRPDGRRLVLQVEDAHQQIDRIEVYLKGDGVKDARAAADTGKAVRRKGGGKEARIQKDTGRGSTPPPPPPPGGVVLVIEDGPVLCPPACPIT